MAFNGNVVTVESAVKSYGNGHKILDNLFMTVPRGSIYGLLGASGCGKTTLLSCIVGRKTLNSGKVSVFGKVPGSSDSGVPGPRIGYMPQDIALVGELSVRDCAYHFGWIYGMTNKQIEARYSFLEDLLQLPPRNRYVKNLSGGQQRRVSLAVALIHEAELLILDEPTVGLDPILRQNIWDFLVKVTSEDHKTVIITTHYIEEARQASLIGMMRNGQLLHEGPPEYLISRYRAPNLEHVFYTLSARQESSQQDHEVQQCDPVQMPLLESSYHHCDNVSLVNSTFKTRQKALLTKNLWRLFRSPGNLSFSLLLPILEITMFFLAIGRDPHDMMIGVVNKELDNYTTCDEYIQYMTTSTVVVDGVCTFQGLGCHFLDRLHSDLTIQYNYQYYDDVEEAMGKARHGQVAGVIYISSNFTESIEAKRWLGNRADDYSLANSEVQIWLDMTNSQTGKLMQKQIYETYFKFAEQLLIDCGEYPQLAGVPLTFKQSVYGSFTATYATFTAPGVIVTLIFFLAISITSLIIITERYEGVWDRTLVAGVTTTEILLSHLLTQGLIMCLQTLELTGVSFIVFGLQNNGDYVTLIMLLLVQGLCGMCAGLSISIFCDNVVTACFMSMGSFVPVVVLSGTLWPIEAMPTLLRWFSLCLPTTLATQATRNIMEKGWSMFNVPVIAGYAATVTWIIALSVVSAVMLKIKN